MTGIETEIRRGGFAVKSRFSLSKKAKKTAEAMKELQQSCNFNSISQPPPPAALVSVPLGSTYEFESRKHIQEEIMASLRDDEANVLGICGLGGVGKTTMARRVMQRVREELKFEEIVMAVVGQNVDSLRIQDDIAKSFGLNLGEGSLSSKAHNLRTRLTGRKRSLIVLDDVWENLKLEDLGIPCGSGCKILLTSRDSNVLKRMNADKVYALGFLSGTEAWHLFKSKVGSCIDHHQNVVSVAQQVVQECKGLPIALVTVGMTLKGMKNTSVWEDALQQLRSSNPIDMPDVLDEVYKPLRLSYEFLKSERAKSLLLLCSLFPEDHDIPLEELAIYSMGLRMFEEVTSLEHARNRVCFLVEMLRSRFLLLDGCDKNHVKMHDVVRDVSILIASAEKRINCNDCTWISPFIGERIGLPVGSILPNLRLLLTRHQPRDKEVDIYDGFFEGMRELNVFSITCPPLGRLPKTTALLENLRSLILVSCRSLKSISIVGELVNLEILICRGCDSIESLPVEMGRLSRLRLLELSRCWNLKRIAPGIISNLAGLEELIVEGFDKWEGEAGSERENAALSELQHLPNLTRLEIEMKDWRLAAEQMRLPQNMVKYDIIVGGRRDYDHDPVHVQQHSLDSHKKLELKLAGNNINVGGWIHQCVGSVEYMSLHGDGSRNLDLQLAQNMRWLTFTHCSTVKERLVNMSASLFPLLEVMWLERLTELEEICNVDGPMPSNSFKNLKEIRLDSLPALAHLWKSSTSSPYQKNVVSIFSKLSSIYISRCDRLRSLFSLSMTASSCLLQLERLDISNCAVMEQVFLWNEEENQRSIDITVFPKLKFLSLSRMPRLTSLSKGIGSIEFPPLAEMRIISCPLLISFASSIVPWGDDDSTQPDKVGIGCLKELFIGEDNNTRINWWGHIPLDVFAGIGELRIWRFNGMKTLFASSIARNLLNIKILHISECGDMVRVIEDEEDACGVVQTPLIRLFPNLEELYLYDLCKLESFCEWRCALELPSLKCLHMRDCDNLMVGFRSGPLDTPNLETVKIDYYDYSGSDVSTALQLHRLRSSSLL